MGLGESIRGSGEDLRCGGLAQENVLKYACTAPSSKLWDGLYIDDRIPVTVVPQTPATLWSAPISNKFMDARAEYVRANLERAPKITFLNDGKCTAWGTEVNDLTTRVGFSLDKTRGLVDILIAVLALPTVNQNLMQRLVGLLIHHPSHRRVFLCLLDVVYELTASMGVGGNKAASTCAGRDCGFRASLTHRNARWPVGA